MIYKFIIPNKLKRFYWADWCFITAGIVFLSIGMFIPAFLLFIMAGLGFIMRKNISLIFSENCIFLNTFLKKEYQWNELDNVLLKDGLLTLDFKNNKLIQELVFVDEKDLDENAFNKFCENNILKT